MKMIYTEYTYLTIPVTVITINVIYNLTQLRNLSKSITTKTKTIQD